MNMPAAFFGGSLGAGEILLILVVVLLLFGAQRLPAVARSLGRALEELRRSAREISRDVLAEPPPALPGSRNDAGHCAAYEEADRDSLPPEPEPPGNDDVGKRAG